MTLHYHTFGQGQPVVILHGLFGSSDNWRGIAQKLANNGFQVVTVDLANHGRSPHTTEVSFKSMAADLVLLIDRLQLTKIYLIGHSVGGKVAMVFSEDYSERIEKLAVIDIAPKAYSDQHSDLFDALTSLDLSNFASRNEVSHALASAIPDLGVRQFLLMNLEIKDQQFRWKLNLNSLAAHYDNLLVSVCTDSVITIPTCFIRGDQSDYILDNDAELINDIFTNAVIITIKGAGHWVHADAPELFLTHITEFFDND
ncbi:MAG: alpha/beta fold hydrolase [Gammaproteobacteria bacterium]|nr:alpha/beta fold hydrolase [Gammaproteobacteria bacterium]